MATLCHNYTSNDTYNVFGNATSLPPCVTSPTDGGGGRGGGGGGGYGGRFGPPTCGYCTTSCIYKAVEITFIIGIFANLLVIFRVLFDRKVRDPTFTAIACLAVADLAFLTVNVAASLETVVNTINCIFPPVIYASRPYYIFLSIAWFAASGHVSLLAVLRYGTLAYPIRANVFLTCKRVLLMSLFVWVLGIIFMGSLTLLIVFEVIEAGPSRTFQIYLWFFVYLMPLVITVSLHVAKMRMVKRAIKGTATEATRLSVERMAKIVMTVIVCAAILPFPRLLYKILNIHGVYVFPSKEFQTHFKSIAQLFYLINNFINPFLYGFMSSRFRDSVREMFSCGKYDMDDSVVTSDTPLAQRKQMVLLTDPDMSQRSNSNASLTGV